MSVYRQFYDVIGVVDNRVTTFARGIELDRAQTLKSSLDTNGIGGDRDENGGYQGSIQNAQSVSNLQVVPSTEFGIGAKTAYGESFSITSALSGSNGYFYLDPAQTIEEMISLEVITGPSSGSNVVYDIAQNGKIEIFSPTLTTTDTVSASYYYRGEAETDTTTTLASGTDVDGLTYIFTTDYRYNPGSVTVTFPATGGHYVEGGGTLVEIYQLDGNTRTAFPSGEGDITINYTYNAGDQETVPASGDYRTSFSRRVVTPGIPQTIPPAIE